MDEEQRQRQAQQNQMRLREMERKSKDIIRIYNPLEQRFKWYFDGFPHVIEPKATKDVERYLARLYFDKMSQYIIGQLGQTQGEQMIEKRKAEGKPDFLDKYEENRAIWDKVPKLNDPKLLAKLADELIVGLVEEYGLEVEDEPEQRLSQKDTRTLQEQIFDSMDKKVATDMTPAQRPIKKDIIEEVTVE